MKKKYLIILILLPYLSFSQMRKRLNSTDLEHYNLKGDVKKITHKEFVPRFSNDSTYILKLNDFLAPLNYIYEFNRRGNLTKKTELREESDTLIVGGIWNYQYDEMDRILEEQRISFQFFKDTIIYNYEYLGDSIINIQKLSNRYKTLYSKYIQKGNKEILNQANSDSSYLSKGMFVYDNFNRIKRFEEYENKFFVQYLEVTTYKDSISRNKFKEIFFRTKYDDNFYYEYVYDQNDNPVRKTIGNFKNYKIKIHKYEYTYDEKRNWIEKRCFEWKGKLSTVLKREIRYYEY